MNAIQRGDLTMALEMAVGVATQARASGDRMTEAEAVYRQGQIAWLHADSENAAQHLRRASEIFEAEGNNIGVSKSRSALAMAYALMMAFDDAVTTALSAVEAAEAAGDEKLLLGAQHNLGGVYTEMSDFDAAERIFSKVVERKRALGNHRSVPDTECNVVWARFLRIRLQRDYDPSGSPDGIEDLLAYTKRVLADVAAHELSGSYPEGLCRVVESIAYSWSGNSAMGKTALERAIQIGTALENPLLLCAASMAQTELLLSANDGDGALSCADDAVLRAHAARNRPLIFSSSLLRARTLTCLGRHAEAADAYRHLLAEQRRLLVASTENRARVGEWKRASAREKEALRELSLTDPLTGLMIRRALDDLGSQLETCGFAPSDPLSCLMIDVNDFKRVNDTMSHRVGDEVLRVIADTMRSVARRKDVAIRHAGDEFVMVLPGADSSAAAALADRLHAALAERDWSFVGWPVTVSCGAATGTVADDVMTLIAKADASMYEHKRETRGLDWGGEGNRLSALARHAEMRVSA